MNTKKSIIEAAFSLFERMPFEKITVQQIIDKAEVSRGTFYKHFSDKYELMTLYYKRFADNNTTIDFNGKNIEDTLCLLLDFIETNRAYFINVKDTEGPNSFWDFLRKYSLRFYGSVKCHNEGRDYLTEQEHLTLFIFIEGSVAVFRRFVEGNLKMDKKELAETIYSLLPDSYKILLHDEDDFSYIPFDQKETWNSF